MLHYSILMAQGSRALEMVLEVATLTLWCLRTGDRSAFDFVIGCILAVSAYSGDSSVVVSSSIWRLTDLANHIDNSLNSKEKSLLFAETETWFVALKTVSGEKGAK
jgi:hypothetical protein